MNRFVRTMVALATVAALSGIAFAQDSPEAQQCPQGRGMHQGQRGQKGDMVARLSRMLDLTDAQKSQLEPLAAEMQAQAKSHRESMQSRMRAILTPEQQAQMDQLKADGSQGRRRGAFKQLNLTDDQKSQLKALREEGQAQRKSEREQMMARVNAVLTPDQQAKLAELKARRQQRMQEHRGQRGQGQPSDQ